METGENCDTNFLTKAVISNKENFDLSEITGGDGFWQRRICLISLFFYIPAAFHMYSMSFLAPNLDHWCARPLDARNLSVEQWRSLAMPPDDKHCSRYMYINVTHLLDSRLNDSGQLTIPCEAWEYDTSSYHSTVLNQFDLVCGRKWLVSLAKSVFIVGISFSLILFGFLSDRIGRKPVIIISGLVTFFAAIISAFSKTFLMFLIARFFIAFGVTGLKTTAFILLMEVVAPKYRNIYGVAVQIGWTIGSLILPLIAWLIRDSFWFQIAIVSPCLIVFAVVWLPESPRWLLNHGKTEESKKVLQAAAKINGVIDSEKNKEALNILFFKEKDSYNTNESKGNVLSLVTTPGLRQITLIVYFCWFVIAFVYYGLSINTNELAGDPFINFALSVVVEIPADLLTLFLVGSFGKRKLLTVTMTMSGIACFTSYLVPSDLWLAIAILSSIGKFAITAAFCLIYVYTSEIFPTVVRNIGLGSASLCARLGSFIAPFMREVGYATHPIFPQIIFGVLAIVSGLLVFMLPETKNRSIPDTIEEAAELTRTKCRLPNDAKENCITVKLTDVETNTEHEAQNLPRAKITSSL